MRSKIRAITFDAAGTLIEPHPSVGEIYREVLEAHCIHLRPEILDARFRAAFQSFKKQENALLDKPAWREIVFNTLGAESGTAFDLIFEDLWETFALAKRWRILPGAIGCLEAMAESEFTLAVFSNNDSRLHSVLDGLALRPFFEHVFVSTEIGFEKPALRAFECVQAALAVPGDCIVHVGDSEKEDIEGAQAAGWESFKIDSNCSEASFGAFRRFFEID